MSARTDGSPRERLEELLETLPPTTPAPEAFARLLDSGQVSIPHWGEGRTRERFSWLVAFGQLDCALGRLIEGHADGVAILEEAKRSAPTPHAAMGVWAAGPVETLRATLEGDHWMLSGLRRWCSGAGVLSHALVRAMAPDGERLFLVQLEQRGVTPIADSWMSSGMAGSVTLDVAFDAVSVPLDDAIETPGFYLDRPGFWVGAAGVAAVWLGGVRPIVSLLARRAGDDAHRLAHLGAAAARYRAMETLLMHSADLIDRGETDPVVLEHSARSLRAEVEHGVSDILTRTGRATGADPLAHDRHHAQRVADLTVYLRQSHGEADLEALGRLARCWLIEDEDPT